MQALILSGTNVQRQPLNHSPFPLTYPGFAAAKCTQASRTKSSTTKGAEDPFSQPKWVTWSASRQASQAGFQHQAFTAAHCTPAKALMLHKCHST